MVKKVKARGNGAYSAPHILEKPMVGHVTEGIEEEASWSGWRCGRMRMGDRQMEKRKGLV